MAMSDDTTSRLGVCPHCGYRSDAITSLEPGVPVHDGGVSICVNCGLIAVIDSRAPFGLRLPTPDERSDILADVGVKRALHAWLIIDAARKRAERRP